MSKRDRELIAELEALGYAYDRRNSKGLDFYIHEDVGCEVRVRPGIDERGYRSVIREARQQIGVVALENKRNPQQIRERNAAEHERAKQDLERARAARDALTYAGSASEMQIRGAEEAFLRADRLFRYWDRLMREAAS